MKIRAFCEEDIADVCRLIRRELGYDVSCEALKARVSQMQHDGNYRILIATDNAQIIGFAGLQICLAFEVSGKIMRVIALAVDRAYQRTGVGSALMQEAEAYATEHGVTAIFVNSGLRRIEAHRFYEKQSFYKKGYSFCKWIER